MHRNCSRKPTAAAKPCTAVCADSFQGAAAERSLRPARVFLFARRLTSLRLVLFLFFASASFAAGQWTHSGFAQESGELEYPLAPYSIALPFPEDDQQSVFTALLLPRLQQAGGQDVSPGYFPGRGGSYAWREISGKENTGHVLAILTLPTFFLQAAADNPAYTLDDITILCILAYAPCALWVPEDSPIAGVGDLIALGRDNPQPQLIAGTGSYSDHEIATRILARAAGIPLRYLPYTGSETASKATMDKTTVACWGYALDRESMPGMRPLAVAGHMRSPALPDIPTFVELDMEVLYGQYIALGMPAIEDEYTAGVIGSFFSGVADRDAFMRRLATAGYIPFPLPYADKYSVLPRAKMVRETREALSHLAAAGYVPHPPAFTALDSTLLGIRTELEALLEEYPRELR